MLPYLMENDILYYIDCKKLILSESRNIFNCDTFISAYNDSQRVKKIFSEVTCNNKYWFIIPEYGYNSNEFPVNQNLCSSECKDEDCIDDMFKCIPDDILFSGKLCIDITGFMRPHILYMLVYLLNKNIKSFNMLYTEPEHYGRKEDTQFSMADVQCVRPIIGFSGLYDTDMSNDLLIIGIGYDHDLVARVVENQNSARVIQLLSLPSLSADMYQESILRLARVADSPNLSKDNIFFSSANDPYVTAKSLSDIYYRENKDKKITNLYLSPLATKPQTLGFGLFYLKELIATSSSIIFPFSNKYNRETGKGVGRSWLYDIVFD